MWIWRDDGSSWVLDSFSLKIASESSLLSFDSLYESFASVFKGFDLIGLTRLRVDQLIVKNLKNLLVFLNPVPVSTLV